MSMPVILERSVAVIAAVALLTPGVSAAGQKGGQPDGLTVTTHMAPDGGAVVVAEGRDLRFEHVAYPDRFTARVTSQQDEVVVASLGDQITVTRAKKSRTIRIGTVAEGDLDEIRDVLRGSRAVRALRLALSALESSDRAEAQVLVVIGAVIEMLDGDITAVERRGRAISEKYRKSLRKAGLQTASACYAGWEEEVYRATLDFEACKNGLAWWQFMNRLSCSLVYSIRINGAFYWYLGCIAGAILR